MTDVTHSTRKVGLVSSKPGDTQEGAEVWQNGVMAPHCARRSLSAGSHIGRFTRTAVSVLEELQTARQSQLLNF